jgi:hypothetical protein
MSSEDNKALVRRFFEEVFNEKRLERADEFVAPDDLDHAAVPGQGPGLEGAKQQRWALYFATIPDLHVTIDAPGGRGGQGGGALPSRGHTSRGSCWASLWWLLGPSVQIMSSLRSRCQLSTSPCRRL